MTLRIRVCLAALLTALVSGPVQAQSTDGVPALLDDGRPLPVPPAVIAANDRGVTVRATRITAPMTIDGRLDEAVYAQVPPITAFVQQEPRYGTAVSEATSAWVFYDDTNFYVACRCLMADMNQVVANDMRRDSTNLRQNDNFGVFLDTFTIAATATSSTCRRSAACSTGRHRTSAPITLTGTRSGTRR